MNLSLQLQKNKVYDENLSKSLQHYPSDPLLLDDEERKLIESVKDLREANIRFNKYFTLNETFK